MRKHKKSAVRRHFALIWLLLLVDGDFSSEDVAEVQNLVIENAQRTYEIVISCFRENPGISSLPVVSLFVLLACVTMDAPEVEEAGLNTNLRTFVNENLLPVMSNATGIVGTSQADQILDLSLELCDGWNNVMPSKVAWEPNSMQALVELYDKEVGDDKLHLPDPATEKTSLFDDQQKPAWIKLARKLSKQPLHHLLREAARFEHLGALILERYSDKKQPSTEQAKLLSYLSYENTDN